MPSTASISELIDFVVPVWAEDTATTVQDAYKWIYQAARGGEHAIADEPTAFSRLQKEWNSLASLDREEPLWVPLTPDGHVGRLNIRPFKATGGSVENLFKAFVESSSAFEQGSFDVPEAWNALGKYLSDVSVGDLHYSDWVAFNDHLRKLGFPAMSHSPLYRARHFPAYRIVIDEQKRQLLSLINE